MTVEKQNKINSIEAQNKINDEAKGGRPRDALFTIEVLREYPKPQQAIWLDMHQCYSSGFVAYEYRPDESQSGNLVVKHLLSGGRGHYGPFENPQITLNCGWFPHSVMQQLRTHRVGLHFSVQSFRYSGEQLSDAVTDFEKELKNSSSGGLYEILDRTIGRAIYLRPVGSYSDRNGSKYEYTLDHRYEDLQLGCRLLQHYKERVSQGLSEEHARGLIPFDVRQHWVMSANVRSLMHLLDLRWKADAQLECQQFCDLVWPHFQAWVPEIAEWYDINRAKKARLAP